MPRTDCMGIIKPIRQFGRWIVPIFLALMTGCAHYPQSNALLQSPPGDLPWHVELTGVPFFPQTDYQCGPASLASMLTFRGVSTNPQALAPLVYVPQRQGSFQLEMVAATRSFGMAAYQLEPEMETILREVADQSPVLVLQNLGLSWWPVWHFAVVVGYDLPEREIILHSGTNARETMKLGTFERSWSNAGYWALVVTPPAQIPLTAQPLRYVKSLEDLRLTGHADAALAGYLSAMQRWPQQSLVLLGTGNLAYTRQHFDLATQAFLQLIREDSEQASGWNNLAYALAEQGCGNARAAARCALSLARSSRSEDSTPYLSTPGDIEALLADTPKPENAQALCPPLPACSPQARQ